jgi:hypothetical protein
MKYQVALAGVLVGAAACATVQSVREPARFIAETNPAVVYVTHKNRALLTIANPRVSGDTVLGVWEGSSRPIAVALSQVTGVRARQPNRMRTTLLIGGVATFTAVAIYAIAELNSGEPLVCDYAYWPPRCQT